MTEEEPTSPRTEAGRALIDMIYNPDESWSERMILRGIAAIEREAADRGFQEGQIEMHEANDEREAAAATPSLDPIVQELADLSVTDSSEFRDPGWADAVRALIRRARARLDEGSATPEQKR